MSRFLYSPTLTLLNVLGVLGVPNRNVQNVLNVLHVINVLNMPMDASLTCWALFFGSPSRQFPALRQFR